MLNTILFKVFPAIVLWFRLGRTIQSEVFCVILHKCWPSCCNHHTSVFGLGASLFPLANSPYRNHLVTLSFFILTTPTLKCQRFYTDRLTVFEDYNIMNVHLSLDQKYTSETLLVKPFQSFHVSPVSDLTHTCMQQWKPNYKLAILFPTKLHSTTIDLHLVFWKYYGLLRRVIFIIKSILYCLNTQNFPQLEISGHPSIHPTIHLFIHSNIQCIAKRRAPKGMQ